MHPSHTQEPLEYLDEFDTPGATMCVDCMACSCCEKDKLNEECSAKWEEDNA